MQVYFRICGNAERFIVTQTTNGEKKTSIGFTGRPEEHALQDQIENGDTCYAYITTVVDGVVQDGEWQNTPMKIEVERSKTVVQRGRRYEADSISNLLPMLNVHLEPENLNGRTYEYVVEVLFPQKHDLRTFTLLYGGGDFGEVEIANVIP